MSASASKQKHQKGNKAMFFSTFSEAREDG
jgi:hypothetical protein